jgi:formylglycine-generating enzyme required for sulfatase activity
MSGNVFEWCRNKHGKPEETKVDISGNGRVVRGGSWDLTQYEARAACRYNLTPDYRIDHLGFRVVRRPPSHVL